MNTLINPESELLYTYVYTKETSLPFDTVVSRLPEATSAHKFSILNQIDFKSLLKEKGFPIERNARVIEICQAKMASDMLTHYPLFSNFMPCKISVFEFEGKTVISTMNMESLIESLRDHEELYNNAKVLFDAIKQVIEDIS